MDRRSGEAFGIARTVCVHRIFFLLDMKHTRCITSEKTTTVELTLRYLSELNIQSDHINPYAEPLVLLPLEVMVKPLDLRFQYHFSGDRPTNKLDKVGFTVRFIQAYNRSPVLA